jgi:hypothetical protein
MQCVGVVVVVCGGWQDIWNSALTKQCKCETQNLFDLKTLDIMYSVHKRIAIFSTVVSSQSIFSLANYK